MSKIEMGDVFEIQTSKGKAYLHYIHEEPEKYELVRVLYGLYQQRPTDIEKLVAMDEQYLICFPLKAAYRKKIIDKVGHVSASNYAKPTFMRDTHWVRGEFHGWQIINLDTLQIETVQTLTPEQERLSQIGIWNDTLLRERLEAGWTLEQWSESRIG